MNQYLSPNAYNAIQMHTIKLASFDRSIDLVRHIIRAQTTNTNITPFLVLSNVIRQSPSIFLSDCASFILLCRSDLSFVLYHLASPFSRAVVPIKNYSAQFPSLIPIASLQMWCSMITKSILCISVAHSLSTHLCANVRSALLTYSIYRNV